MAGGGNALPAEVKEEIRKTLAVHGREICMRGKAEGAKKQQQQDMLEKSFHGTDNHVSLLNAFLNGKPPYEAAFTSHTIQSNREGNAERNKVGCMLELKETLHCQIGLQLIVHERGFTKDSLSHSSANKLIDGRNLDDKARTVCANYKHAHRFFLEYTNGTGTNPSGKTFEDMLTFVRQKMFVAFRGAKDAKGFARLKGETKTKEVTAEDMPATYVFSGQMAFALFGPMPLANVRFSCLSPDLVGVPKQSRKEARKEEAKAKQLEREQGVGGHVPAAYVRGAPIQAKASAAHMAQKEWIEERQNLRELMFIASNDHSTSLKELRDVTRMLKEAEESGAPDEEVQYLQQWKGEVFDNLKRLREHKRKLQAQSSRLMEDPRPKKALKAYMEQVGDICDYATPDRPVPKTVPGAAAASSSTNTKDDASSLGVSSATLSGLSDQRARESSMGANLAPAAPSQESVSTVVHETPQQRSTIEEICERGLADTQDAVDEDPNDEDDKLSDDDVQVVQQPVAIAPRPTNEPPPAEQRLDERSRQILADFREKQRLGRMAMGIHDPSFDAHDYYGCYD